MNQILEFSNNKDIELQEKLNEINIELENKSFLIYKERIKIAKIFKKKLIKIFKNLS